MSNLLTPGGVEECTPASHSTSTVEALPERTVQLGALEVHRVLPVRGRRLIGPWCFFDRFGPLNFGAEKPMDVAPHPHIGLQTVTWLLAGEVIHNDSLGSECVVRPGQLSLMTAGRGIAHTEETPAENSGRLDGVQLWVALPERHRGIVPHYQCTKQQPSVDAPGGVVTAILGEFAGVSSEGSQYHPGAGAEIAVHAAGTMCLPLNPDYEYGALLAEGDAGVDGTELRSNILYYLGVNRAELRISSRAGARLVLIGGAPFGETILMWWNFVARTAEEIANARESWESHNLFGEVPGYKGERLAAPVLRGRPIGAQGNR